MALTEELLSFIIFCMLTFLLYSFYIACAALLLLLLLGLCSCLVAAFRKPPNTKLKLEGLPELLELQQGKDIQSTADSLRNKTRNDPGALPLISRLGLWNQLNSLLNTLNENGPQLLDQVINGIEMLMNYHQLNQDHIEADLMQIVVNHALQDSSNPHLFAYLCQRLIEGKTVWVQNPIHRLFQIIVQEFNRPNVSKQDNALKLMAVIFKRNVPGVPDHWITNCFDYLIRGLDARREQSTEQLCLFFNMMLINESDHNRGLLPSQQQQLSRCVRELVKAIPSRKAAKIQANKDAEPGTETEKHAETEESDTAGLIPDKM